MKIFVICSKSFYDRIPKIRVVLEKNGWEVFLPNCYDDPATEARYREMGREDHSKWKGEMLKHSTEVINEMNAVLVLNFEKRGIENYVGGATFLEMYDAFRLGKPIFMYNDVPEGILKDEIIGFCPKIIDGDLSKVVL